MRHATATVICTLASILLFGCGPAEFTSQSAQSKTAGEIGMGDDADGNVNQDAFDDSDGRINGDDNDDADGSLPQMTADEAAGMVNDLLGGKAPTEGNLEQILENELDPLRCYISHSGGHGIDMCMQDTSPVQHLSPRAERGTFIEIKGNQLCVPLKVLLDNLTLFQGAVTGECAP